MKIRWKADKEGNVKSVRMKPENDRDREWAGVLVNAIIQGRIEWINLDRDPKGMDHVVCSGEIKIDSPEI